MIFNPTKIDKSSNFGLSHEDKKNFVQTKYVNTTFNPDSNPTLQNVHISQRLFKRRQSQKGLEIME